MTYTSYIRLCHSSWILYVDQKINETRDPEKQNYVIDNMNRIYIYSISVTTLKQNMYDILGSTICICSSIFFGNDSLESLSVVSDLSR